MNFEHYIITRFNLPIFTDKISNVEINYLRERLELFKLYCLPSIKNQTCQNFNWLILLDHHTPKEIKESLHNLCIGYENFHLLYLDINKYSNTTKAYIDLYNDYSQKLNLPNYEELEINSSEYIQRIITPMFINEYINNYGKKNTEYYITTRIDNDDMFHKKMIETIQNRFKKNPEHCILDYINGYKYNINNKIPYIHQVFNGHFTTLIEKANNPIQSILYWSHPYIENFVKTYHIRTKPLYCETIHNSNVINNCRHCTIIHLIIGMILFKGKDYGIEKNNYLYLILSNIYKKMCLYIPSIINNTIDFFLKHTTNKIYYRLYKQQKLFFPKINKINTRPIDTNPTIIFMSDGNNLNTGIADKLRGIISLFKYAKDNNYKFIIEWNYPFNLDNYLIPNLYNWNCKLDLPNTTNSYSIIIDSIYKQINIPQEQEAKIQHHFFTKIINKQKAEFYKVWTNAHWGNDEYNYLFNTLFKLHPRIKRKINHLLPNSNYVALHFRFRQLLNDFKDASGGKILSKIEQNIYIDECISVISKIYESEKCKLLIVSDSYTFLKQTDTIKYTFRLPGEIYHSAIKRDSFDKEFIDLFMLSKAKKIYIIHKDLMYYSGFAEAASFIGNCPLEIVEI